MIKVKTAWIIAPVKHHPEADCWRKYGPSTFDWCKHTHEQSFQAEVCASRSPTLCLLRIPISESSGWAAGGAGLVALRSVGGPAVGAEALLWSEGAHVFTPVGAVEQVAAEAVSGLPRVLLHHRHAAVRVRAAGVQAVLPGVHPVRGQKERGPLLDGGLGAYDALPYGAEVAHAGVSRITAPGRLVLLELFAEFLQQLLHSWYFGF